MKKICKNCNFYVMDYSLGRNCMCPKIVEDDTKAPDDGMRVESTGFNGYTLIVMPEFGCIHWIEKETK